MYGIMAWYSKWSLFFATSLSKKWSKNTSYSSSLNFLFFLTVNSKKKCK